MCLLILIAFLRLPTFQPIVASAHDSHEGCQVEADRRNKLHADELAVKGLQFVCFELKGNS